MKKIINILVGIMCLCMLATFASAYGDMTYHFNTDHVKALAFDCEDDECTQVSDFSGSFPNGKTTNNGRLVIRYPSTLQTEHGYAVYFVSPGYLPKEGRSYLHTYGNDNIAEDDTHITFDKKDECQSVIDDFSTINDVYENEPLQINISSSLDAETASAFKETHADPKFDVEYVPDELKNRYYSSDVRVDLTIEDSNDDVVETQEREFTWDNGNPIYMDETADVHFDWTPQEEGQHIAEVSTEVTDAQCSSSLEASSQKEFDVLDERPTNECYTLLNNLDFDNLHPKVGETLNFSFNKISNYADGDHNLYPTETELTYQIYNSTDDMIAENSMVADANSNAEDPEEYGFYWTPEESGKFTIRLEGVCQDSRCDGVENHEETIAMEFTVQPEPTYEVEFEVSDSDSHFPLENVSIRMNGETRTTNEEGMTTFTDLLPDEYSYEATKEGYEDYSGSIEVINVDQKITFTMNPDEFDDPAASLSADVTDGFAPLSVELTCKGNGETPLEYTIDYGEGVTETFINEGTSVSSVHEYDSGQYTATCNVTGSDGDSAIDTVDISVQTPECDDGVDNDGDGLIDMNDPGCDSPQDNDESDATTECQDGVDNDGDGLIDMNDPGCDNPQDNNEEDAQDKLEFTSENPPETAYVSVPYEHDINAQSIVTSDIEFEKFKGPESLSVNDEGNVEWTPLPHDIGENEVIIKATDGYNTRYLDWTIDVESKQPKMDVKRNEVVVSQVRYPSGSVYYPGQTASLTMRVDNTGDYDLDNLEVMVMSHSFGMLKKESFMDIDEGNEMNERIDFRLPENTRSGQHMLRIKVKSEDVKYTTHRPIEVR